MRYKRYLYTGEPMPRATRMRHRRMLESGLNGRQRRKKSSQVKVDSTFPADVNGTVPNLQVEAMAQFIGAVTDNNMEQGSSSQAGEHTETPCATTQTERAGSTSCGDVVDIIGNITSSLASLSDTTEGDHPALLTELEELAESDADQLDVQHPFTSESSLSSIEEQALPVPEHHTCEEENNDHTKELTDTLCPCTETTVGDVVFSCLVLGLRHSLTWEAQIGMLQMINSFFKTNKIPCTKYSYFQYFEENKDAVSHNIYCPDCEVYLGKRDNLCAPVVCTVCNGAVDVSNPSNFFLSISMEHQFRKLLQDPHVATEIVSHRFNRKKENIDALEDIYDGLEYRKHFSNGGVLSHPYNFSYSFFVDGISTGTSTGKTLWPIYATINELPFKERSKYVVLAGLYIGNKDPNQFLFLQPFVEEANKLSLQGFSWNHHGKEVRSKVLPLCAITDSVARPQVLNMQSFRAYYGCTFCYQKQEKTRVGPRWSLPQENIAPRTHESTSRDAMKAYERRNMPREEDRHCKGVKGPSMLMSLMYFNLINGFVVDHMHALFLGVIKTYMELIFEDSRKKFWHNMNEDRLGTKHLMSCIDDRLLRINPPSCVTRTPRSITVMKLWKATEWRSWLLFYCLPCLDGLLKQKYLTHLSMLCNANYILLQKSITHEQVEEAHTLFLTFTFYFEKYFGVENMRYINIHLLSHVCKGVMNWGPLWTHNAFPFEGHNRHLLQLYHSPHNVLVHIARKFLLYSSIPMACAKLASSFNTIQFCENVLNRQLRRFLRCDGTLLLGKGEQIHLSPHEVQSLFLKTGVSWKECHLFQRILLKGMRFTSDRYARAKNNNDSYACLINGQFVVIKAILQSPSQEVFLLVQNIKLMKETIVHSEVISSMHVKTMKRLHNEVICIRPQEIECQCLMMTLPSGTFLCKMLFGCLAGD